MIKLQLFRPNTLLKETPAQASSWEICEIFKNMYFEEHLRRSASNSKKETIHLSFKYLPEPWIVISVDEINRNRTFNCIFFFSFLTKYIEYVCTLIFYDLKKSLICFICKLHKNTIFSETDDTHSQMSSLIVVMNIGWKMRGKKTYGFLVRLDFAQPSFRDFSVLSAML